MAQFFPNVLFQKEIYLLEVVLALKLSLLETSDTGTTQYNFKLL